VAETRRIQGRGNRRLRQKLQQNLGGIAFAETHGGDAETESKI